MAKLRAKLNFQTWNVFLSGTVFLIQGISTATNPVLSGPTYPTNMLQNADFQDDFVTLMPENKTLSWCYFPDHFNRRDYNPDGWSCTGNWGWENADAVPGQRRLMLQGTGTEISQQINWGIYHDDRNKYRGADDGGFPYDLTLTTHEPLRMVRDVEFRVYVKGTNVPSNAGSMKLELASASASTYLPSGTFDWQWVSVTLPATSWQATETPSGGEWTLPQYATVKLNYDNAQGKIELGKAQLREPGPPSPNLLSNGGFEALDGSGYPVGWGQQEKYHYFPPYIFYIFNSWHSPISINRGPVTADSMTAHSGARSLKMIVPSGDEKFVASDPIVLNQITTNLIEVHAWVRTDRLAMLQIDAVDQDGTRLDGYSFVQKKLRAVGADNWRLIRQVFLPRTPATSIQLLLCARGVNGCTLDDTGSQPQNNVTGTIWWDDVRVYESESTEAELLARGVPLGTNTNMEPGPQLKNLDLGELMFGDNTLSATVFNPGSAQSFFLQWDFTSPSSNSSQFTSATNVVPQGTSVVYTITYNLSEPCSNAYTEYHGQLSLIKGTGSTVASNELWFSTWSTPIDIQLGALYLRPEQTNQYVRVNLGLASSAIESLDKLKLEVIRRATGTVTNSVEISATPSAIEAQRDKIPEDVYEDCNNLLLVDVDVSCLPTQPFNDPQRNWIIRVTALDTNSSAVASADSDPFCRLAHDPTQPAVTNVTITTNNLLYVNGQPFMPWGVIYQHAPVYDGPADPGAGNYRDLHNLPAWNIYGFGWSQSSDTREINDFNVRRHYPPKTYNVTDTNTLIDLWNDHNLISASAFASYVYSEKWSTNDLFTYSGGKEKVDTFLNWASNAPMVVSVGPSIEEVFALFVDASESELNGLQDVVEYMRGPTGKPVMVGHGGYWTRIELEKVPFFDLFDPETEPWYPANFHTDLMPFIEGQPKAIWVRPQMYENVPYERWRFHTYVELMRGARGWQMAHGPGDQSLFRGLHAEMECIKPVAYSLDPGPEVTIEPWIEHWSRAYDGKTYIIAATTRSLALGQWQWADSSHNSPTGRSRVTYGPYEVRSEDVYYGLGIDPIIGPSMHSLQHFPDCRSWPEGSKLVQWVYLDSESTPTNMAILVKADGHWVYGASWGGFDSDFARTDAIQEWFLRALYRHASGFLGWSGWPLEACVPYTLTNTLDMGAMPATGQWYKIEIPLADIGVTNKLVDGVGFIHDEGGRIWWSHTSIIGADSNEVVICGDSIELPPDQLAQTTISVAGLQTGTTIRVLFEDRELTAQDGYFIDDFRGKNLYQRFGGDFGLGYGDAPVALHIYEVDGP